MERTRDNMAGFTLLELLLVVTILSAVAWMSLGVVTNNTDQLHFEDTKNRLQAIRRAIIGDTSRTVNGGPEVRGYVADMGRLPAKLQALVAQNYCDGLPQYSNSTDCATAGGTWITQTGSTYDATTGLRAGWNGPYITADALSSTQGTRFHDGWGNDDDTGDFGWNYSIYTDSDQIHLLVQSLGRDGLSDSSGGGSDTYEADFPSADTPPTAAQRLISESEYRIKITDSGTVAQWDASQGLKVDFGAPASCWVCSNNISNTRSLCEAASGTWRPDVTITTSATCTGSPYHGAWQPSDTLCMAITRISGGALEQIDSSGVAITWDGTSKVEEFIFEDATTPYDEDTYLYQGQLAYGIFEYDSTATPACQTSKPFPAGSAQWKNFTYVPGTTLQPFEQPINP